MVKITNLCFVKSFDEEKVKCYFFELKELREFPKSPFFHGMKLYKGKNIVFTTELCGGSMITTCTEMLTKKITQIWNYYVIGQF